MITARTRSRGTLKLLFWYAVPHSECLFFRMRLSGDHGSHKVSRILFDRHGNIKQTGKIRATIPVHGMSRKLCKVNGFLGRINSFLDNTHLYVRRVVHLIVVSLPKPYVWIGLTTTESVSIHGGGGREERSDFPPWTWDGKLTFKLNTFFYF